MTTLNKIEARLSETAAQTSYTDSDASFSLTGKDLTYAGRDLAKQEPFKDRLVKTSTPGVFMCSADNSMVTKELKRLGWVKGKRGFWAVDDDASYAIVVEPSINKRGTKITLTDFNEFASNM